MYACSELYYNREERNNILLHIYIYTYMYIYRLYTHVSEERERKTKLIHIYIYMNKIGNLIRGVHWWPSTCCFCWLAPASETLGDLHAALLVTSSAWKRRAPAACAPRCWPTSVCRGAPRRSWSSWLAAAPLRNNSIGNCPGTNIYIYIYISYTLYTYIHK